MSNGLEEKKLWIERGTPSLLGFSLGNLGRAFEEIPPDRPLAKEQEPLYD